MVNHIAAERTAYSEVAVSVALARVEDVRRDLFNTSLVADVLFGKRFRDNKRVIEALESNVKEKGFMSSPDICLRETLLYLAAMDYYYEFEKDYE